MSQRHNIAVWTVSGLQIYFVAWWQRSDLLRVTLIVRLADMQRPEAIHHSDLEVTPPTDLEQTIPPGIGHQDKCYHSGPHQPPVEYPGQCYDSKESTVSIKAGQRRWYNRPAFGLPTLIVAICLAIALGGGLGKGLATQRKSWPAT